MTVIRQETADEAPGEVYAQDPRAGDEVEVGSMVEISVAIAPPTTTTSSTTTTTALRPRTTRERAGGPGSGIGRGRKGRRSVTGPAGAPSRSTLIRSRALEVGVQRRRLGPIVKHIGEEKILI